MEVYGDSAYGTGELLENLEHAGARVFCKTQPPRAPGGRFTKTDFTIDLDAGTVTCPAEQTVKLRPLKNHRQIARFGKLCHGLPTRRPVHRQPQRTQHPLGQTRTPARRRPHPPDRPGLEDRLHPDPPEGRTQDQSPNTPQTRRPRARVRGSTNVAADFSLLAAAVNLARFAVLGLDRQPHGWALNTS